MLTKFQKLEIDPNSFCKVGHYKQPFGKAFHYHPEFEIQYTIKGEGTRFVGDSASKFKGGEVVFLGANLPHCWQGSRNPQAEEESIVIQFSMDLFGSEFMEKKEVQPILDLFKKARNGICFSKESRNKLIDLIWKINEDDTLERIISFLMLLKQLSESRDYDYLSSVPYYFRYMNYDEMRIKAVIEFTDKNYSKNIRLDDVASICNLTVTSFCRFFKKITGKTYYDHLLEIRMEHACRLLGEGDMSIEQVSIDCGFENISNFYRSFKKIKGTTPGSFLE